MTNKRDIVAYFRSQKGFEKLFRLFRKEILKEYVMKGFVRLSPFSEEELEPIAEFLELSVFALKQEGRISLFTFDVQLKQNPFTKLSLTELLELYFNEPIFDLSKVEDRREYLRYLEKEFPPIQDWLAYLKQNTYDSKWIYRLMEESPEEFEEWVLLLAEGIRLLPTRPIRLSVFSEIITLETNAFHTSETLGQLWLHVLSETKRLHAIEPISLPETKKGEDDLLQEFNLFKEDITDAVTIANLFAETNTGYHPMWETAVHTQSVLTVPLREVIKLTGIYPAHENPVVWVVDNPEIFTQILDEVPTVPMVCPQEKWTCSAWEVFDRLEEAGVELRFVGDLTPESIVRAEDILLHYPSKARTWKMDVETYLKTRDRSHFLSEKEKKVLNKHHLDELACVKDEMKDRGNPAYLLTIIDDIISELSYHYNE